MNIFGVEVADPITPNIGGFNVNPVSLLTGTGSPIIPINTPKTPEEQKRSEQVGRKMAAGFSAHAGNAAADIEYLKSLYDDQMRGFSNNPEDYKGVPTAERAAADVNKMLQRNALQTANQNARLGKMGVTKGADSFRMAYENSLANQQGADNISARASWDEYKSKLDEMNKNLNARETAGSEAMKRQWDRARATNEGWQGELGRLGKSIVEGAGVPGLVGYGASKLNQGLGNNDEYFRNTFGDNAVTAGNLLLDPNESARQLQAQWTRQAGKPNPTIQDPSKYGLDPFRGK